MTTEICKHCNGWRGLHKWDTMQCPYMGTENENWQATTYEEADETAAVTIAAQASRIAELEARVKELEAALEEIQSAAEEAQGEWHLVSILYTPEKIAPYKEIEDIAARALLETK